jgi:hypothetical protein
VSVSSASVRPNRPKKTEAEPEADEYLSEPEHRESATQSDSAIFAAEGFGEERLE